MTEILKGYSLIKAIENDLMQRVEKLKSNSIIPALAIIRVGASEEDLAYERSAVRRCESVGIQIEKFELAENIDTSELTELINTLNKDVKIHGILMFRPLPKHIDEEAVVATISPEKDVDGCTPLSLYKVFAGDTSGFAPCTPEAVVFYA